MTSWSIAYRRHGRAVQSFLLRRLCDREEAEDLCQETFMRAMKAEGQLRDPEKLRPYLFRIAHNLMVDRMKRRGIVRSESELGTRVNLELIIDPEHNSPETRQGWRELTEALRSELDRLPEEQRRAFELGVLQRLPYAEVSQLTGWSTAKVKINVFRARKQLVTGLREFRPFTVVEGDSKGRGA